MFFSTFSFKSFPERKKDMKTATFSKGRLTPGIKVNKKDAPADIKVGDELLEISEQDPPQFKGKLVISASIKQYNDNLFILNRNGSRRKCDRKTILKIIGLFSVQSGNPKIILSDKKESILLVDFEDIIISGKHVLFYSGKNFISLPKSKYFSKKPKRKTGITRVTRKFLVKKSCRRPGNKEERYIAKCVKKERLKKVTSREEDNMLAIFNNAQKSAI